MTRLERGGFFLFFIYFPKVFLEAVANSTEKQKLGEKYGAFYKYKLGVHDGAAFIFK